MPVDRKNDFGQTCPSVYIENQQHNNKLNSFKENAYEARSYCLPVFINQDFKGLVEREDNGRSQWKNLSIRSGNKKETGFHCKLQPPGQLKVHTEIGY